MTISAIQFSKNMNLDPVVGKSDIGLDGTLKKVLTLDSFAFLLNSIAMGDVIAAAPVIKYMIEKFYRTDNSYRVVAKQQFRDILHFVPDYNFIDFDDKTAPLWGLPSTFAIGALNKKNEPRIVRSTPKSMLLGQYASLIMADRLLDIQHLNYVPLEAVDVSKFGVDFSKAVILVSSYRDATRMWEAEHILGVAEWLKQNGKIPVFIGKTDMDATIKESIRPKTSLPINVDEYGVDLRNKTTIKELASIFSQSLAVCGVDSGPIHLAGTTSVPIICGYTSVAPEFRIPVRTVGKTYSVTAPIECIGCESRWRSNYWNYEDCYFEHAECSKQLTSERFINILSQII